MAKVAIGLVIAFLVFYIITSPDQAANIAGAGWQAVVGIAHGIGRFVNKLAT